MQDPFITGHGSTFGVTVDIDGMGKKFCDEPSEGAVDCIDIAWSKARVTTERPA